MKVLLLILALFIGLGILAGAPELVIVAFTLVTGWFPATQRLLSNALFTGAGIVVFAVGCAMFLISVHGFIRWVRPWSFRWTLALTGTFAFVLLSIMSFVGLAHQTGWLLVSHEPLFNQRWGRARDRTDLERTAKSLANLARTNQIAPSVALGDPRMPDTFDRRRPWEKFHLLVLDHTNDYFVMLWYRDAQIHGRVGSVSVTLDGEVTQQSADYLTKMIGEAQRHVNTNH